MFTSKAKHLKTVTHKTRINVTFALPLEVDLMQLFQIEQMDGFLSFNSDPLKKRVEEMMKNTKIGASEKGRSKSQILRGVLFLLSEQENKHNYEEFYNSKMDEIIEHFKKKLD